MSHPALTEELVRETLRGVKYPGFSRDIVSFGLVREIQADAASGNLMVRIVVATNDPRVPQGIKDGATAALEGIPGVGEIDLRIDIQNPPNAQASGGGVQAGERQSEIPGVKHIVAVASGKGGVGKSTVAANLALALAATGAKVGLCDCDLYGPSVALMFGVRAPVVADDDERIIPNDAHGIKLMSMAFLLSSDEAPAVLRGPMVTRLTQQFLRQVNWGELDVLVLDLPPGTGDIQLTIVQTVALDGAVLVTTPQEMALIDARKGASMFAKTNVPLLGLVENMSYFVCPDTGKRYDIFGAGGGEREAARLRTKLLGQVPLDIATREGGDRGLPIVLGDRQSPITAEFMKIAQGVRKELGMDF
ncbi:MAG: Mrp/NBP35 family ATP-binding protein [Verrucomicrobia bacterium]|nr:Mrp/NBP35 family ATP-binding protein [Verrucomicrobiota bacterium]